MGVQTLISEISLRDADVLPLPPHAESPAAMLGMHGLPVHVRSARRQHSGDVLWRSMFGLQYQPPLIAVLLKIKHTLVLGTVIGPWRGNSSYSTDSGRQI